MADARPTFVLVESQGTRCSIYSGLHVTQVAMKWNSSSMAVNPPENKQWNGASLGVGKRLQIKPKLSDVIDESLMEHWCVSSEINICIYFKQKHFFSFTFPWVRNEIRSRDGLWVRMGIWVVTQYSGSSMQQKADGNGNPAYRRWSFLGKKAALSSLPDTYIFLQEDLLQGIISHFCCASSEGFLKPFYARQKFLKVACLLECCSASFLPVCFQQN